MGILECGGGDCRERAWVEKNKTPQLKEGGRALGPREKIPWSYFGGCLEKMTKVKCILTLGA